jgi:tetratricopeptide (TPR) repeat protein
MAADKKTLLRDALKLVQAGKTDKAIENYKAAAKLDPRDATVHNLLGDLYAKRGNKKEAIGEYIEASGLYEKDGFGLRSIAICQKVVNIDPGQMTVRLKLADLYAGQKLPAEARAQYLLVADYHDEKGDVPAALEIFRKIADLEPGNLQVRVKLAGMFEKQKFPQKAAEEYVRAARGHLGTKDPGPAAELFARAFKLHPDNVEARFWLADHHAQRRDWPVVVSLLEAPVAKGLRDTRLLVLYAEASTRVNRPRDAVSVLEALRQGEPNSVPVNLALGRAYIRDGEIEKGTSALDRCVSAHLAENRTDLALPLLHEMAEAAPDDERILRRILEVDSNDEMAAERLRHLASQAAEPPAPPPEETPAPPPPAEEPVVGADLVVDEAAPVVGVEDEEELIFEIEDEETPEPEPAGVAGSAGAAGGESNVDLIARTIEPQAPESKPEPEQELEVAAEPEPGMEPGFELALEPEIKPEPETTSEPAVKTAPEGEQELEIVPEPMPEPGPATDIEPETAPVPEAELELEPQQEQGQGIIPEPLPESGQGSEVEPGLGGDHDLEREFEMAEHVLDLEPELGLEPEPEPPLMAETMTPAGQAVEMPLEEVMAPVLEQVPPVGLAIAEPAGSVSAAEPGPGVEDFLEPRADSGPASAGPEPQPPDMLEEFDLEDFGSVVAPVEELGEVPALPDVGALDSFGEEIDLALGGESAPPSSGSVATPAAPPGAPPDVEGSDLTDILDDLRQEFDAPAAFPVSQPPPQLEAGLVEIFQQFQRSVKERLGDEDFETHYNLGIAYKEMGLVDEAIAEFALAEKSQTRHLDAVSMIALCLREKGRLDEAALKLRTGISLAPEGGEEQKGFLYDLAAIHEQAGRAAEAREALERLLAIDPCYRDVAARVGAPAQAPTGQRRKKPKVSYL